MDPTPAPLRRRSRLPWVAWAEWVERGATEGPRLLRPLFEAELAFDVWAGAHWRRIRPTLAAALQAVLMVAAAEVAATVERAAAHLTAYRHIPDQLLQGRDPRRLTRTWAAAAMILAVLSVAAADTLHPAPPRFLVDRIATGAPAQSEALALPPPPEPVPQAAAPAAAEAAAAPAEGVDIPAPPPPPPAIPAQRGPLPVGKGMWIYVAERAEGGNADAIVARATATGLTHLYVRTASLKDGFIAADFLNRLLPKAHAAGLRVYAWDFPYLDDVAGDVNRALAAIQYRTPDGHRVDGYVADIELRNMGVNLTPQTAADFGSTLRRMVGPNYPMIACVPRPSPALVTYPFAEVVAPFDAIAPMVYWMGRDPAADLTNAVKALSVFNKPIIPVGQAYDGAREGGPAGVPPREQLQTFMQAADAAGVIGVSWWSWQHADQQAWDAIRDAPEFVLPAAEPAVLKPGQVRAYQWLLTTLGFPVPATGTWDDATTNAVRAYQTAARLPVTGIVDQATRAVLFSPFGPPIQQQ
jgi:putative peptidoglycan binding protein